MNDASIWYLSACDFLSTPHCQCGFVTTRLPVIFCKTTACKAFWKPLSVWSVFKRFWPLMLLRILSACEAGESMLHDSWWSHRIPNLNEAILLASSSIGAHIKTYIYVHIFNIHINTSSDHKHRRSTKTIPYYITCEETTMVKMATASPALPKADARYTYADTQRTLAMFSNESIASCNVHLL